MCRTETLTAEMVSLKAVHDSTLIGVLHCTSVLEAVSYCLIPLITLIGQFYADDDKIYYNSLSQKCNSDLNTKTVIYTLLETFKKANIRESKKKHRKLWRVFDHSLIDYAFKN